jgi:ABC-2 type transport system permease protein
MKTFYWLVKREFWEHRGGFLWAPVITGGIFLLLNLMGIVTGEIMGRQMGINFAFGGGENNMRLLTKALDQKSMDAVGAGLDLAMYSSTLIMGIVLGFVVFFYCLGALYDDRRDRSILFWKSLPVSDTSTVLSKVIAAIFIAPVIAMLVTLAGYIGAQIIVSGWFLAHGVNPFGLLWAHTEPFALWVHLLAMIPVDAVWALPTVGWLLMWSAAVRSKPFLWAVVIPIVAGVLNFWVGLLGLPNIDTRFFWGDLVGRALLSVVPASWIAPDAVAHGVNFIDGDQLGAISYGSMGRAFTMPEMWIGAVVGIALIAAAIWFRRWRDEA